MYVQCHNFVGRSLVSHNSKLMFARKFCNIMATTVNCEYVMQYFFVLLVNINDPVPRI